MELWLSYIIFISLLGLALVIESIREEAIKEILREEAERLTGPIDDDEEVWYSQDGISWYRID